MYNAFFFQFFFLAAKQLNEIENVVYGEKMKAFLDICTIRRLLHQHLKVNQ